MGYGITLIEYAKTVQNDLDRGVIETFASGSPILGALPFRDVKEGAISYLQEDTLPGIAFRNINAAYTPGSGVINPQVEKVKILGGEIDTDIALIRRFGMERRTTDITMKVKAAARYFDKIFIDGDELTTIGQFDGLNKRLTGSQLVHMDGVGTIGGALTENAIQRLIDAIDTAPDLLIMGKKCYRQVVNLFKGSSILAFSEPNYFGFRVPTYGGIPIGIIDKDNSSNVILDFDETEGSSSGTAASMYAVKFGTDSYLCGIQSASMVGKDLGEISSAPVYRYRLDWDCGIALFHPRCAARLCGILVASGVL